MERVIEIDFQRCFRALISKAMALLMALIFGIVTGCGISLTFFETENEYTVYSEVSCIGVSDAAVVPFYAEMVKTANVAKRAAEMLNNTYSVSEIMSLIQTNYSANLTSGIPIIEIGVVCENPEESVALVDAVTESFIVEIQTLTKSESVRRLGESTNVEMLYNASKTHFLVIAGTGLAFALLLAAVIVLREILALELTTVKDGLLGGELKLIGVIPRFEK